MSDNTAQERMELIKTRLASLEPSSIEVIDDSHLHVGHVGSQNGAGHFTVKIRSAKFNSLNRVQQQRLVYSQVSDLIPYPIHALAIQTLKDE